VLKAALVIALSITLAVLFLVTFAYWWFRYRVNRFRRDLERTSDDDRRWRQIRGDAQDL
jgi:cbb3-type cytochrome oxidase subunit 3